jgi:hypothetical protein
MKKFLKNEKGSILVMASAIIVCLVSVVSAASLLGMVRNGQLLTQYEHDSIQQELLLRSESVRGHLAIEHNPALWPPPRTVQINQDGRRTYYEIKSKTENTYVSLLAGQPIELVVAVKSLITCKRGTYNHWNYISPVARLSERLVKSQSLAQYQYFTNTDLSENEDGGFDAMMVKFWGPDVLWGPVHSNSDIYIQQAGGGSNNGWPTFHSKVTTAGRIKVYPSGANATNGAAPVETIFLGGLEEEIDGITEIIFEPDAAKIEANGLSIGAGADIVYVKMSGSSAEIMLGSINFIETQDIEVYSWYPETADEALWCITNGGNWYEDTDNVWTNEIAIYDTTWSSAGNVSWFNEGSYWVPDGELWIEGEVSGKVTWGCADTIYITNDIYYTNTQKGFAPDEEGSINPADYFGLVSERSILVRYKHQDPFTPDYELVAPNCDDQNVYLYGAYAALGEGDAAHGIMKCHGDGIFSFQYQHGHGSTPNFIAPSPYISAEFTIESYDAAGNGWEGAYMDVIVEGTTVLNNITVTGSQSTHSFNVDNGDIIETVYTNGTNDDDNSYVIFDEEGNAIAGDGPPPGPGISFQIILPIPDDTDTLYSYIDLHKYIFPKNPYLPNDLLGFNMHGNDPPPGLPCCGFPYEDIGYLNSYPNTNSNDYAFPYGTDLPWYNPVYPEPFTDIIWERGTLHIWGAIAQRRRGFIHRSGEDLYNHPGDNEWDVVPYETYHYDGEHGSCGYQNKDYHYDNRLLYVQPPNYPEVYEGWGESSIATFNKQAWYYKSPAEW